MQKQQKQQQQQQQQGWKRLVKAIFWIAIIWGLIDGIWGEIISKPDKEIEACKKMVMLSNPYEDQENWRIRAEKHLFSDKVEVTVVSDHGYDLKYRYTCIFDGEEDRPKLVVDAPSFEERMRARKEQEEEIKAFLKAYVGE